MARYLGPTCRLCRSAGEKLFLKGDRCFTSKCAIERNNRKPGPARNSRTKESEYAVQLRETQKIKRTYGVLEAQFYNYYVKANAKKGITGEILLQMLERRLDSVVYRLGLAKSRSQARQFVKHGHILVNNRRVDIPSFQVSKDDMITYSNDLDLAKNNSKDAKLPEWIAIDDNKYIISALPNREHIESNLNEQMVVEFYSR
jgi:small subunit ribosomal protein S4